MAGKDHVVAGPGDRPVAQIPAVTTRPHLAPVGCPYLRGHVSRFGAYATDDLARQPEAFNPVLKEVDCTAQPLAA
jgi:hypothetical protein